MKPEKRRPKPGFCLVSAMVWTLAPLRGSMTPLCGRWSRLRCGSAGDLPWQREGWL